LSVIIHATEIIHKLYLPVSTEHSNSQTLPPELIVLHADSYSHLHYSSYYMV